MLLLPRCGLNQKATKGTLTGPCNESNFRPSRICRGFLIVIMENKKIKCFTLEYGGESVTGVNLEDNLEMLTGKKYIHELEPEPGEDEVDVTITISYMTQQELNALPEYQ